MKGFERKIEVTSNCVIALVALLIGVVLVKNHVLPSKAPALISAGMKMSIAGVDWAANGKTLVLALQKDCKFCSASAPFYRRLIQDAQEHGAVHLLAVLPSKDAESRDYLGGLGVSLSEVRQAELGAIHVQGTPTLILVDSKGTVERVWIGQLPSQGEKEMIEAVFAGNAVSQR